MKKYSERYVKSLRKQIATLKRKLTMEGEAHAETKRLRSLHKATLDNACGFFDDCCISDLGAAIAKLKDKVEAIDEIRKTLPRGVTIASVVERWNALREKAQGILGSSYYYISDGIMSTEPEELLTHIEQLDTQIEMLKDELSDARAGLDGGADFIAELRRAHEQSAG